MKRRLLVLTMAALVGVGTPAAAQQPAPTASPALQTLPLVQDAEVVRDRLQDILRGYPRSVGEVLRRDPSLMARPDYMGSYPQLAKFIAEHPEVPRNVEFYFEGYGSWGRQYDAEYEAMLHRARHRLLKALTTGGRS